MGFDRLTIRDAKWLVDAASGQHVYHVRDPHALVQATGYLKSQLGASNTPEDIFLRGETRLHKSLVPSLWRGLKSQGAQNSFHAGLRAIIGIFGQNCPIFSKFSTAAAEPLLQHYGLKTSWIDLVDNVWVALWFACHRARSCGIFGEYLHFERRVLHKEPDGHVYILLVGIDATKQLSAGVYTGPRTELIDLRVATPSIFLRPHSQHGLLFRCRGNNQCRPIDYATQVRGIIRIDLADALDWLGIGNMLNPHALFPPPVYDFGYRMLLAANVQGTRKFGVICHVGT